MKTHPFDGARRGFSFHIAAIVALVLAVTLLTPSISSATDTTKPQLDSPSATTTTSKLTGSGTEDFWLTAEIDYSSLPEPCKYWPSSWAYLTNDATGETQWSDRDLMADDGLSGTARFKTTGVRYPGGSVTLRLYSKLENGYACHDSAVPSDASSLVPHHIEKINIGWDKPEVLDVYASEISGISGIAIEVSPSWTGFTEIPSAGGVAMYLITDYGTPQQVVKPISSYCYHPGSKGNICYYQGRVRDNEALGVAALPTNIVPEQSTTWPPQGAISHRVGFTEIPGPEDIPEMTKGGPSESAMCNRVCTGDPIDTYSGNFYETKSDLTIPGRIGIDVSRHYSVGNLGTVGAFGDGWTLGYDMSIEGTASSSTATVIEPSGNRSAFSLSSALYTPVSPMLRADLVKTASGWEYTRWDENLSYVFDLNGKLVSIKDRNNNVVTIERTGGHISKIEEGSRSVALTWVSNRLTSAVDHTGRTVSYQYDGAQQLASRTDPMGKIASYAYDSKNRVTTMTFEDGGVAGNVYDDNNRVTEQALPSGKTIGLQYGVIESSGKVANVETTGDVVKTFTYLRGRIISFMDSSDPSAGFKNTYNTKGLLLASSYTNEVPKQDIFNYDSAGNLIRKEEALSGAVDEFSWDAEHRLTAHTEPSGVRTESTFDGRGNLISSKVVPTDGAPSRSVAYGVSASGEPTSVTNPLGGVSAMEYNTVGDLVSTTDPVGGRTSYENDPLGRPLKIVSPGGNTDGVGEDEAAKFTESFTYDANGNVTETSNQFGTTSYQYDPMNRPVSITDARSKTKTVAYEPGGKPAKITHPDGSVDAFTYNVNTGERTSWTDPQKQTTTYSRSGDTRTTTAPDGTVSAIRQTVGPKSITTELIDDEHPDGIVVRENHPLDASLYPHGGTSEVVANHSARNSAGQVTRDISEGVDVIYEYNGFGELAVQAGADRNVAYGYDPAGNINSITYPDGTAVSREMDAAGRVTKITDWKGVVYTLDYNASGQISSMVSSTGLSYTQTHDGALATSKVWKDSLGTVLASFENTHEASGLLTSDSKQLSNDPADVRDFQWTDNGALAKIGSQPVTWDGRLLTNTGSLALDYDAATGRVTSATGAGVERSYGYDSTGNRISVSSGTETTEYQWDLLDKLTRLDGTSYSYGNDGLRTSVGEKQQVYDQGLKLLTDGSAKYLWSPDGSLLAQDALVGSLTPGVAGEAITDTMGSVYSLVTQENGVFAALAQYSYSAFGERTLTSGADVSAMGFTSEQHDDSGLIYLRFRYMDPHIGQFISVDPMVGSTLDPYGYASGNPLQMTDPLGLMTLFGWSDDTWSSIGFGLGVTATVATIAAATILTGGAALIIVGGIATTASIGSAAIGTVEAIEACDDGSWGSEACSWATGGAAIGLLPYTPPMRALNAQAIRTTPRHLSRIDTSAWELRRTNTRFTYNAISESGYLYDLANPC